jgi:hypothetical protein
VTSGGKSTLSRVPEVDMRLKPNRPEIELSRYKSDRFYKKGRTRVPAEVRFWVKVNKTDTCWLWTAGRIGGYGSFDGRPAHSWVAKNVMGVTVTHKMVIDHACRNQLCVRPHPEHLRFVSQRVNLTNGPNHIGQKILQTHCKRGHELSGKNLYLIVRGDGRLNRHCRTCAAMRQLEYIQRRKAKCAQLTSQI